MYCGLTGGVAAKEALASPLFANGPMGKVVAIVEHCAFPSHANGDMIMGTMAGFIASLDANGIAGGTKDLCGIPGGTKDTVEEPARLKRG